MKSHMQVEWHEGGHTVPADPTLVAAAHEFCNRAVALPAPESEMSD
jgi:hypothetical protein